MVNLIKILNCLKNINESMIFGNTFELTELIIQYIHKHYT